MRKWISACLTVTLLVIVVGCGSQPGGPDELKASVVSIELTPQTLLLTQAGETRQLTAQAFDSNGQPLAVGITWRSLDPSTVTVSADGLVTAVSGLGSAQVVAEAEGLSSLPALILIAEPVAGAVLVADEQVVGEFIALDDENDYDLGWRYRVTLRGVGPLLMGDIILGTGELPLGGRVVTAEPGGADVLVTLEVITLDEMFAALVINESFDLSRATLEVSETLRASYELHELPDGTLEFTPRAQASLVSFLPAQVSGTRALGPFTCKTDATFPFSLPKAPSFTLKPSLSFELAYDSRQGGLQKLATKGSLAAEFKLEPKLSASFEGKVACELELAVLPIPIGGPIAFVVGGQVPLGVGFDLKGKLVLAEFGVEIAAKANASLELGVACPGGEDCAPIFDTNASVDGSFKPLLPNPDEQFKLEAEVHGFAFADIALGTRLFKSLRLQAFRTTAGLKQKLDLMTTTAQVANPSYASSFDLRLLVEAKVGEDIEKMMRLLKVKLEALKVEIVNALLAESPKGSFVISPTNVTSGKQGELGDLVTFTITLAPITYLGLDAVDRVEVVWQKPKQGGGFTLTNGRPACHVMMASSGQTTFECQTDFLEEHAGEQTFYAVVYARLFGVTLPVPLELSQDAKASVTVRVEEDEDEPALLWSFDEDLEGWNPGAVDELEDDAVNEDGGWGTARWQGGCGRDRPRGCVKLDGVGGEGLANAWIYQSISLPEGVTTLTFETSAHNRDEADSVYRVRVVDDSGAEHVLVDWTATSGSEGVYHWHTVSVGIAAFAGRTVTFYFEGADNGPGYHEQRYYDNIRIE